MPEDAGAQGSGNVLFLLKMFLSQRDRVLLHNIFVSSSPVRSLELDFLGSLDLFFLIIFVRGKGRQDFGRGDLSMAVTEILLSVVVMYWLYFSNYITSKLCT